MTSLQNIDNKITTPIHSEFNKQVLKMNMNDIVKIALVDKPQSIYKSMKMEEEKTIDILMLMLIKFQDFYNCKSKMDRPQLEETAYIICQQFRHFNYYDIGMCLKLAKMNEKIFDRIDGGMILEWLTRYDITRTGLVITEREKQKTRQDSEWSALGERSSVQRLKDFLK